MESVSVGVHYASPLADKYINDFASVSDFYEYNPYQPAAYTARRDRVLKDFQVDRQRLVCALEVYNKKLNCGPKTLANLEKLVQEDTMVVITGQQAGVMTGPLYTVYKAITSIQLAAKVEAEQGIKAVPMFWVAAEDHDYAEIDHIDFVNKAQELVRLRLEYQPLGKYSIGNTPVPSAVQELMKALDEGTNPSEWKPEIMDFLKKSSEDAGSLADWFTAIMTRLFYNFGLIMIDPMLPALKSQLSDTFKAFLAQGEAVNEQLNVAVNKLRSNGYEPQVVKEENNSNLFLYVKGERLPLFRTDSGYAARGTQNQWTFEELQKIAEKTPELLSPNVVLRPIAQDVLLPILAYVAGPGEISYYGLYREIYSLFGLRMPIIYPRVNMTLVERGIAKAMDKYGVKFEEGLEGIKEKTADYLAEQDKIGIDDLFDGFHTGMVKGFRALAAKVSIVDAQLKGHGDEALNKMSYQLEHFQKKVHQYHRKSQNEALAKFRQMENNLFPLRGWQERALNIYPYLFKYGPNLVDELVNLPLLESKGHFLVYL